MILGPRAQAERLELSLSIVRIALAVLLFIHGAFRASHWDPYVTGFGEWLSGIGFPEGFYWAAAVTIYELIAPLFILARRFVTLACLGHMVIVGLGLVLVHWPAGWFVVGAGRNGMEYSVLLLAGLAAVAWAYAPKRGA
ncbi:MAG TPA: DoxX family protein [Terricaulis sp.]|nr:DoxX family protein [Terricaulis sp.]HRP09695.1 DoxX family protein [Terricaulis sp.]